MKVSGPKLSSVALAWALVSGLGGVAAVAPAQADPVTSAATAAHDSDLVGRTYQPNGLAVTTDTIYLAGWRGATSANDRCAAVERISLEGLRNTALADTIEDTVADLQTDYLSELWNGATVTVGEACQAEPPARLSVRPSANFAGLLSLAMTWTDPADPMGATGQVVAGFNVQLDNGRELYVADLFTSGTQLPDLVLQLPFPRNVGEPCEQGHRQPRADADRGTPLELSRADRHRDIRYAG